MDRHRRNLLLDERSRIGTGAVNPRVGEGGVYFLGQIAGEIDHLPARYVVKRRRNTHSKCVNIDHCAVFRDLLFTDRSGHPRRADQSLLLFAEGREDDVLFERQVFHRAVDVRQRDDAGPIVNRSATVRGLVIMRADDDLFRRAGSGGFADDDVLDPSELFDRDLFRLRSHLFKQRFDGIQPVAVFAGNGIEFSPHLFGS